VRLGHLFVLGWVALGLLVPPRTHAATLQRWVYCPRNLLVDQQVNDLELILRRAATAGYTHVLLADAKFAKLGDMDERYFRNVERVKRLAGELHLEIVPTLFPIGYSNDLLWHDPNLIEGLPVRDALFVVKDGVARLAADPPVRLKGGDFSDLNEWDWKDACVVADQGVARMTDPKGQNARIVQKLKLAPFRQYHLAVRVKTQDFRGTPEVKVLAGDVSLNWNHLGVKPSQDWTTHHVVFNSLDHREANLYLGCWGGTTGSLWWDDAQLEEVGLLNLIRRDGAPLVVNSGAGEALTEGKDFERVSDPLMGSRPWKGEYDLWHEAPWIKTRLPDGTKLRVSYYHAVTVYDGQANICPSEPKTLDLLRDQARRMHAAWGAQGYFMSHDEIRVLNWCDACQRRHLEPGAILADNVRKCAGLLREVNPGGRIYVWSDMFDPHHNAVKTDYYLVRGDLTGSWEGLAPDIIIVPWYFEKRAASLKWFADRGHRQLVAGYYDGKPEQVRDWLDAAQGVNGMLGVMYTTWQNKYDDLEAFSEAASAWGRPGTLTPVPSQ
jgi:hypothetical protein